MAYSSTAIMMSRLYGISQDKIAAVHTEAAPLIKTMYDMAQIVNMVNESPPAQALNLLGSIDSRLIETANSFDPTKSQFAQEVRERVYVPLQTQFSQLNQKHEEIKRNVSALVNELNQVLPKIREGFDAGKSLSQIKTELGLDKIKTKQADLKLTSELETLNTTLKKLQPELNALAIQTNNLIGTAEEPIPLPVHPKV